MVGLAGQQVLAVQAAHGMSCSAGGAELGAWAAGCWSCAAQLTSRSSTSESSSLSMARLRLLVEARAGGFAAWPEPERAAWPALVRPAAAVAGAAAVYAAARLGTVPGTAGLLPASG